MKLRGKKKQKEKKKKNQKQKEKKERVRLWWNEAVGDRKERKNYTNRVDVCSDASTTIIGEAAKEMTRNTGGELCP
jgi:hypothetical protein